MFLKHSRIPLGRADLLASTAIQQARQAGLPASDLVRVGGLRRYSPTVEGAALLAVADQSRHPEVLKAASRLPMMRSVLSRSPRGIRLSTERGLVELHVASPESAGAALAWHTGTRRHTTWLKRRAAALGFAFRDGLWRADGSVVATPDEIDFYRMLGLPYVSPELREGEDERSAAEADRLPGLVSVEHIRGDLHMHSTWSDGRDSILQMVQAARDLGYRYVAITDHSERCWASRKLLAAEVPIQRQEIQTVRAQVPDVDILHGVEVDIMPDGSLDFDDELLAGFDIVLASLHDAHGHDGPRLMERYLRAIEHPLVNVITHPANRAPAQSHGYDLDFDRLFEAARDSGTALEIDGAPGHLDMDGRIARRAVAAGVTIVINSDSHRAEALGRQMRFGIGTARRGWVPPECVLNTFELEHIRDFVARKRAR